jgi:hypothetical protein
MANPEHLEILKRGVEEWNKWRKEHPAVPPDLNGADLPKANLRGANLGGLEPSAHQRWAKLLIGLNPLVPGPFGADLSEANLREANLSAANLRRADLSKANLRSKPQRSKPQPRDIARGRPPSCDAAPYRPQRFQP